MNQPFRITPNLPPEAYTTYALHAPKQTHSRPASCEEVGCEASLKGWVTRLPMNSPLAEYIAAGTHGRRFHETTGAGTGEREFVFPAGQPCFRSTQHVIEIGREPIAVIRGGDWRGQTAAPRRVGLPEWVERFQANQDKIIQTHKKGSI